MQQPNFTLLDLVFQEQQLLNQQPNKCSIKEETAKFIPYNQLGLSLYLEANCSNNSIDKQLFSQILKLIEDKLLELEERMDNRDQIKNINSQLNFLKPPDPYFKAKQFDDSQSENTKQRKLSQQSDVEMISPQGTQVQEMKSAKSQRSKSQLGRTAESPNIDIKSKNNFDCVINKIDLFDKRMKQLTEQVNKLSQKDDQFQRKIEQQVQTQLKDSQDRLIQNEKLFKQVQSTNQEITENQRSFLNHISQMRQEMDYFQQEIIKIQEENKLPLMNLEQNYLELQKTVVLNNNEINQFKQILDGLENDFLILLKKFKDLQNDLAKKKLNSSMNKNQLFK